MSGFLRPGQTSKTAFGVSFDADKDKEAGTAPPIFNANEHLALSAQRKALPIAKYRSVQFLEFLELDKAHKFCLGSCNLETTDHALPRVKVQIELH